MPNALVIVAKAPVVGQVKTRLCPPLSAAEATELFCCFLGDTVERACTLPDTQVCLAFAPADSEALFRALLPFPLRYLPQRGNGLGSRPSVARLPCSGRLAPMRAFYWLRLAKSSLPIAAKRVSSVRPSAASVSACCSISKR